MDERNRLIVMFCIIVFFGYLSFLVLRPFLTFLLFGLILAFLCYPIHERLRRRVGSTLSALLVILCAILVVVIPTLLLLSDLITQANGIYLFLREHAAGLDSTKMLSTLNAWVGVDMGQVFSSMLLRLESALGASIPTIISRTGELLLGLFLMFLVMYYALKEGESWMGWLSRLMPIKSRNKARLREDLARTTRALFYGQVLTSALIGIGCGVVFALFGIESPIFWGFVLAVFAFLPFVGTPLIYVPAGVILLLNHEWLAGIGVMVLCTLVVFFFDYFFRPRIVSRNARIHPLTVIVGAIGGAILMGFVGFLVGPLLINVLLLLLRFELPERTDK